ncbi:MAG: methyltransferase [Acidobacteria bacterium]|nr:MAG: methyltransferase [Acidobacteriota bacterium]
MKPQTPDEVLALLDGSSTSAALGAAMELGLFWLLAERPLALPEIAGELNIPPRRCSYWLDLLCKAGLLEERSEGYAPTATARESILDVYSQDTWALLAEESRERFRVLGDLPSHLGEPGSVWEIQGLSPPMYIDQMSEEPERARRFTRMLFELHEPLAAELAEFLDLSGAKRLLDLGGGSGVVSMALARRYPEMAFTVVDIPNVCIAGRELAAEHDLADRIAYNPADFLTDELPSGFDVALECDVNVYSEALFRKVRKALDPGGRFLIVDQFAPAEGIAPPPRLHWAFAGALIRPDYAFPTAAQIKDQLERAGFELLPDLRLPSAPGPSERMTGGMIVIEARA